MNSTEAEGILRYHAETKHHPDRYARSLGYMDYANQPNPFRVYEGAPMVNLPRLSQDPPGGHLALYAPNRPCAPLTLANVAGFLELSMGLSAWKAVSGSRWSLRMNPSSGNLHPTEAHLVLPDINGCEAGIYHYSPLRHALERRAELTGELWWAAVAHLGCEGFLAGLTASSGASPGNTANARFATATTTSATPWPGCGLRPTSSGGSSPALPAFPMKRSKPSWGCDGPTPPWDEEHPDLLCLVHAGGQGLDPANPPGELVAAFETIRVAGRPNPLSREHVDWEVVDRAAVLSRKPATSPDRPRFERPEMIRTDGPALSAAAIIRRRRSATDFDRRRDPPPPTFWPCWTNAPAKEVWPRSTHAWANRPCT